MSPLYLYNRSGVRAINILFNSKALVNPQANNKQQLHARMYITKLYATQTWRPSLIIRAFKNLPDFLNYE